MSDDMWRRGSGSGQDDEFEDFGELRFSDDEGDEESAPLSFGDNDTGSLPHWTEKPTGELPRLFGDDPSGSTSRPIPRDPSRDVSRETRRDVAPARSDDSGAFEIGEVEDESGDVDVWGSYSGSAPRPIPDRPSAGNPRPREGVGSSSGDTGSGSRPRVRLGEPTGGIRRDDTTGTSTRPIPNVRRDDTAETSGTSRTNRISIGTDDTQGRPVTGSRPRPASERGPRPRPETRAGERGPRTTPARPGVAGRDMPTAIAVGLLMLAAFIAALLWKPVAVLAIVVLVCGLAAVEFFDKVTERGYRPASIVGITASIAAPLAAYWVGDGALPLVFTLALMAAGITFVGATSLQASPMPNMAITSLGMLWIGMMGSFAALLAGVSNVPGLANVGTDTLFMLAVGVIANDVGALFVGSQAGKKPLRAWISPNKTVEGLMGGTLATLISMWVVSLQSDTWNDVGEVLLFAVLIAALAPLGDMFESMLKRNLDIKDFGTVIRGHGGVLDRFDGFLFVLPAAYYLLMVLQPYAS